MTHTVDFTMMQLHKTLQRHGCTQTHTALLYKGGNRHLPVIYASALPLRNTVCLLTLVMAHLPPCQYNYWFFEMTQSARNKERCFKNKSAWDSLSDEWPTCNLIQRKQIHWEAYQVNCDSITWHRPKPNTQKPQNKSVQIKVKSIPMYSQPITTENPNVELTWEWGEEVKPQHDMALWVPKDLLCFQAYLMFTFNSVV